MDLARQAAELCPACDSIFLEPDIMGKKNDQLIIGKKCLDCGASWTGEIDSTDHLFEMLTYPNAMETLKELFNG